MAKRKQAAIVIEFNAAAVEAFRAKSHSGSVRKDVYHNFSAFRMNPIA